MEQLQGNSLQGAMNVEKLTRDVWSHHVETNGRVCRLCGCEKSRNFEDHESCVCGTGSAIDNSLGIKRPINSFQAGGHAAKKSRLLENGIKKMEANFESQPSNSDKIKSMTQAPDLEPRGGNSGKSEVAVHSRRFNDTPAVVPIKKRRIQVMRSPSPPPRSPSPPSPPPSSTSPRVTPPQSSSTSGQVPSSLASSPPVPRFSSVLSPRSAVPLPMSAEKSQVLLPPASHLQPLACEGGILNVVEGVKASQSDDGEALETKEQSLSTASLAGQVDKSFRRENDQQPTTMVEKCLNSEHALSGKGVPEDHLEVASGQNLQDAVIDTNVSTDNSEGDLFRSESGSFNRDDRLHWDLNTDMAAWDASTEQGTGKVTDDDEEAAKSPHKSPCAETSQEHRNMVSDDVGREQVEEEPEFGEEEPEVQKCLLEEEPIFREDVLEEEPEIGEQVVEDPVIGEQIMEEEPEIMEQDTSGNSEHREFDCTDKEEVTRPSMQLETVWNAQDAADFPESGKPDPWDADVPLDGRDAHEPAETHCHHDDNPERSLSKFGKQAKSSSDDAEGWTYASEEPELEEHVDYGDSDCRDADDMGLDVDDRTSLMQEESNWKGEDHRKLTPWEGEASIASETLVKASSDEGQPLELRLERHTASGRSRTSGWDQLPEGFDNAEEALRAAKEVSARRGGRGGSWSSPAGRGSSISSHTGSRFGPGPGPARGTSRDGFSTARGESYFGDRHPDEFLYERDGFRHGRRVDDNYSAHNTVRGRDPGRRPGLFGRGRAGGWVDHQPGHMNQWGPGRHRPSAGFGGPGNAAAVAAARVENSGFIVAPDGTLTKPGGGMGPGRGGIRSTPSGRGGRGGHIQVGRGPHVDMDGGVHYPLRAGVGTDRVAGMNAGGRGFGMGSGPGYAGGMHDRGGRGSVDRYRGGGMESRRSESPRRPHPLDHPNMMGRLPGMRPDSRVLRSRTPPVNHRSTGPTEFTAARNQRSPPPSSRWSSDKREADSYQDRDFKRPLSRSRVPSQRSSPHVVHGSSLTDERDRQVLAGSRHSPPVKGSSVNSAHLRKSRDDSLESRPPKRSEEDDVRHTGPFFKDGEYRRSSPTREGDRDREKGNLYRRDRERDDDRRRDPRRSPSRDGRFTAGGPKHASTREADDDIAPRRRRPS